MNRIASAFAGISILIAGCGENKKPAQPEKAPDPVVAPADPDNPWTPKDTFKKDSRPGSLE